MFTLRRTIIKFITPLAWRLSKSRKCSALLEFSLIERDSASQLMDALKFVDDPRAKAGIFQHVLEEYHHADLFEKTCDELSTELMNVPVMTRHRLVSGEKANFDKLGFLTYVYVGEKNVNRDFSTYARISTDKIVSDTFLRVQADEANHEADTFDILKSLAGHRSGVLRWNLLKAEWLLWYRAYVGYMRRFGELFLTCWLAVVYFALGWVVAPACRTRLELHEAEQLKVFRRAQENLRS